VEPIVGSRGLLPQHGIAQGLNEVLEIDGQLFTGHAQHVLQHAGHGQQLSRHGRSLALKYIQACIQVRQPIVQQL